MTTWAIPLFVATIAAIATLAAAYIAYAKDRKDERANILQDLEIIEKLDDGDHAKALLRTYVYQRSALLPLEKNMRFLVSREVLDITAIVGILGAIIAAGVTGDSVWKYVGAFVAIEIVAIVHWVQFHKARTRLIRTFATENNLPIADLSPSLLQQAKDWWRS